MHRTKRVVRIQIIGSPSCLLKSRTHADRSLSELPGQTVSFVLVVTRTEVGLGCTSIWTCRIVPTRTEYSCNANAQAAFHHYCPAVV
jgi:hypothetical protein